MSKEHRGYIVRLKKEVDGSRTAFNDSLGASANEPTTSDALKRLRTINKVARLKHSHKLIPLGLLQEAQGLKDKVPDYGALASAIWPTKEDFDRTQKLLGLAHSGVEDQPVDVKESAWQKLNPNKQMVELIKNPDGELGYVDKFTREPVKTGVTKARMQHLYNNHYRVATRRRPAK